MGQRQAPNRRWIKSPSSTECTCRSVQSQHQSQYIAFSPQLRMSREALLYRPVSVPLRMEEEEEIHYVHTASKGL